MALFVLSLLLQAADTQVGIGWLSWHPSGKQVLFSAIRTKKDWSDYKQQSWLLILHNLEDGTDTILDKDVLFADFAPDGKSLVLSKKQGEQTDLWLRDLETGEEKNLTQRPERDSGPHFNRDGSRIAFHAPTPNGLAIFTIKPDGSELTQITPNDGFKSYSPRFAPDSDRLLFYLEKGDNMDQIYLTDPAGKNPVNLTHDQNHNFFPRWLGPNAIVFARGEEGLFQMDLTTGKTEPFLKGKIAFVAYHSDSRQLAWFEKTDKGVTLWLATYPGDLAQAKSVWQENQFPLN